ncbi:MAG: response regulator [Gammaproteobacteria bacterium]|nr:response regulator [Gammaproteobacteria bacterium]
MRVLFVDDEPNILSGIRRMMRSMRNDWEMDFVGSGAEALAKIEVTPCDVIVSDMCMPGMDGAQLLSTVKDKLPGAIRIALSGQTDQKMIYRCIQNAHQYLAKPCDAGVLIETVRRACMLRELLEDEELATRVKEMSSIPSLPEQYARIMEELQSDDASLQKIGEIVESDVAMTAKILQLVNSAFFGLTQHVATPAQATMLLGVDVIRTLVLTSGVFSQFDENISKKMDLQSIWSRSAQVGALAKAIAIQETQDKLTGDYAFMAGMLMDVGLFVLASNLANETVDAWQAARRPGASDWEVERDVFGQSHMEVGAYLVGLWGLPDPIIAAVAYHHTPSAYSCSEFSPLTAVHAALAIVTGDGSGAAQGVDVEYLETLHVADRLDAWQRLYQDLAVDGEVKADD